MGTHWVAVRDAARANDLTKRHPGVEDIATRWDQLIRYAALKLSSDIGVDVEPVLPRAQRDHKARINYLIDQLSSSARLDGALRIPNTAGDVDVIADLHGQQLVASLEVSAPEDRGAKARVTWIVNQLKDAPGELTIEAYPRGARAGISSSLAAVREERQAVIGGERRDPARFRIVMRTPMGIGRKSGGKAAGFIDSVLALIDRFYGEVVQTITPWTPPAPKLQRPPQVANDELQPAFPPPGDDEGPARRDGTIGYPAAEVDRSVEP